jgi:hypothetical protein
MTKNPKTTLFTVVMIGSIGANNAIWRKIQNASFGASFKVVKCFGMDICVVIYDGHNHFASSEFETYIGKTLVSRYNIEFTHC